MINMYNSFSEATTSFQKYSADPELAKLFMERAVNPAGDIMGPDLYRMAYGAPASPQRPINQRMYHVQR